MLKPLWLPCKCYFAVSMFLAFLLGVNKFLLFKGILSYKQALKVQSWLYHLWQAEQKWLCNITFRVIQKSFRNGEIPLDEETLEYYRDLKALEAEGRYEIILNQLYVPRSEFHEEGGKCTTSDSD